jgi:hypothetical protein
MLRRVAGIAVLHDREALMLGSEPQQRPSFGSNDEHVLGSFNRR